MYKKPHNNYGDKNTMLIAICDDDKKDREILKELITNYCRRECISFFIDSFTSGKQFLQAEKQYHILFMDIYLEDTIGTEIVKECKGKLYNNAFLQLHVPIMQLKHMSLMQCIIS
jgi:hypothetical protein